MCLVRTYHKYIKVNLTHNIIYIAIRNHFIYKSDSLNHIHTFFGRINQISVRLESGHDIRFLYCDNEIISKFAGTTEKMYMSYMKKVVHSYSKHSFS